jgi:hypothetical protein
MPRKARTPIGRLSRRPSRSVRAVVADVARRLPEWRTSEPQLSICISACSDRNRRRRKKEYGDHSVDKGRGRSFVDGQHDAHTCSLGFEGVVHRSSDCECHANVGAAIGRTDDGRKLRRRVLITRHHDVTMLLRDPPSTNALRLFWPPRSLTGVCSQGPNCLRKRA